ncbi:16S rRNA (cytidine(1402)-2'-O)-methyltransferase [Alloprevotella sp. OH1205_COT-284]|uniref:16S rRNA (cytidine(1402)-2'-O)-methyltransferase n=1 Tax=Alloprevotella sp. OH1205_COT-284 TaxID=2491043 RepID=UPI000F5F5BEA|nr:16S rRNA (cytidine(1402)-2'-O)-methyltransferase [Alloprevotella sp. OH1205_COT-284]RRD79941.1 16S rRNA (cytidine(1402)-2'-O)-methyltransferase [Alloprevotella sp. OH1205_COT-284]
MLYLVPTPVGNLEDITLRAMRILKEVDLILAEDTRTSGVLLKHYDISTRTASHHKFNEHQTAEALAERMAAGENMALISDAGTPGISDPGFMLVRAAIAKGVEVQCLPGATAFVPALVASGLPCERFCFEGFLPQKKGRRTKLEALRQEERTMIFYESPYRVVKTLELMAEVFGKDRRCSVCREISKLHEESVRGTLDQLSEHFREHEPRGEFVIVVGGCACVGEKEETNPDNPDAQRTRRKAVKTDPVTGQPIDTKSETIDKAALRKSKRHRENAEG